MAENRTKMPHSASPVARSGAGDISEREYTRERYTLQTTPTARMQPAHPKKQLFSVPVSKFTAKAGGPSPNLARIRSCLDEIQSRKTRPAKIGPKAVSLEDLTPTKKTKTDRAGMVVAVVRSPLHGVAEEQAAARVGRFMLVAAWRRRRDEVRCLRKTLETQVTCSERLRIQVCTLKSLLDSDNAKVRLAIRELERLKQLLRDKDLEKAVLEREKRALEDDVCAAEDRASEMSIGWRNARNELEAARAASARCELALARERAQRPRQQLRLSMVEEELSQHEEALSAAQRDVAALRTLAADTQRTLDETRHQLHREREVGERGSRECCALQVQVCERAAEAAALRALAEQLGAELAAARQQLAWWPAPLTRMMGSVRSWLRHPISMPEAIFWALIPARQGC